MLLKNVRLIKLTTSENILGEVVEESNSTVVLNFPLKVVSMPGHGKSDFSVGMMKWDIFLDYDSPIHFNKFTIVSIGFVGQDVKVSYYEAYQRYLNMKNNIEKDNESTEIDDTDESMISSINRTFH